MLVALLALACTPPPVEEACALVAVAGPDLTGSVGEIVALEASGSGLCGDDPAAFGWSLARTPPASALDDSAFGENGSPAAIATSFTPDAPGEYVVGLIVTQDGEPSNTDLLVVTVGSVAADPVADAGPDVPGRVGERAILDGSASFDPDGATLAWRWTLASTPAGSALGAVWDAHSARPSLVPDVAGTYVLALTVDDGTAASAPDYASVDAAPDDRPPVADAGVSRTLPPCESDLFVLDGTGSYDADGDSLTYEWGVFAAPAGSLAALVGETSARPTFSPDVAGTYTFWLEVDDGVLASPKDLVTLTTSEANAPPVADAGPDQEVRNLRADCVATPDGPRCEACPVVRFRLDGTASDDPDGDALRYAWDVPDGVLVSDRSTGALDLWTPDDLVPNSGQTLRAEFELTLTVADCLHEQSDVVRVAVECRGEAP